MPFDPTTDPNNVTVTVFGATPGPAWSVLVVDPILGDGHYAGPAFEPWQYVVLADVPQAFYDDLAGLWHPTAQPPAVPLSGSVVADLDTLRAMLGAPSTGDDNNLDRALSAAQHNIYERTMRCDWDTPDVQYAILLLATRLYQRRKSPEGVAGFAADGLVVRIIATDPDIARLVERHVEYANAGIG